MSFRLSLPRKNLMRYTKRTLITASAIAFGLAMFLFIDSMLIAAEKDSERNLVWYETGSIRVYNPENAQSWEKMTLKHLIDNPDALLASFENSGIPATPRVQVGAELAVLQDPYPEDGSVQAMVIAVDPAKDEEVYRLTDTISQGRWLEAGKPEAVLGSWLAEDIGAEVGYPITVVTRTRDGAAQTIDLDIVGIVNTPNPVVNRGNLYMDLDYADEMLLLDGAVSQIDLSYPVSQEADIHLPEVNEIIAASGNDTVAVDWRELAADFLAIAAAKRSGTSAILFLVFIIAVVGISNTMLLAMFERRRELGMLRAMGMSNFDIGLSFVLEAGGIGVVGGIFGLILAVIFIWPLVNFGINFGFLLRDMDVGYRISSVFRGIWRPQMFAVAFIFSVFVSMFVAIIPTRQALKMKITDCLRTES